MLTIIFYTGLSTDIEITREEADKFISKQCNNNDKWFTINALNCSTTYNKDNIAMMVSK